MEFSTKIIIVSGVALLVLVSAMLWLEIAHPCMRYGEHRTCETFNCSYTNSDGACMSWYFSTFDCTECLERKP